MILKIQICGYLTKMKKIVKGRYCYFRRSAEGIQRDYKKFKGGIFG